MSHAASRYVKHLIQTPNGDILTIAEKLVLTQVADDHNEDERCAWPSVGNIAVRCCMSEVHCRRLLKRLETKGVLESTPCLRDNGGSTSNRYRFPGIDPPFDKKQVAQTQKRLQLSAALRAARPAQIPLAMGTPPLSGESPPLSRKRASPSPGRETPPLLQESPPLSRKRGGKEPLTELKQEQHPPTPLESEGGVIPEISAAMASEAEELRALNATRARMRPPMPPVSPEEFHSWKNPARPGNTGLKPMRRRGRRST